MEERVIELLTTTGLGYDEIAEMVGISSEEVGEIDLMLNS